jgi:lysophospholipase L1-like esterase
MTYKSIFKLFSPLVLLFSFLNANTLQIMPLGDSITYDNNKADLDQPRPQNLRTAYRSHLWYMLQEAQIPVNFVGSQVAGQAITPAFDPDNEGHPNWTSYDISSSVYQFLSANHADTVLLHIGTNDRSASVDGVNAILDDIDRYETDSGRNVRVLVAMIIGRSGAANVVIDNFNGNLHTLINKRINDGDMLTLVDMYRGAGLIASDYTDITHPNDTGYQKMATVWFNTLLQPYNVALHSFARSIIPTGYIQSLSIDEATNEVSFVTKVPNNGIQF